MYKKIMVTVTAAAISVFLVFSAFAGEWGQDETGYWYKNDSGSYARDQIISIDGVAYGFDQQAYMVSGWRQYDAKWYYFEPGAGNQVSGWKQVGDTWYYLNPGTGNAMHTSWLTLGSKLYYLNADGSMQVTQPNAYFYVGGFGYETDASGAVKRNTSEQKADGRILIYENDGKIKYKNSTLETGNRAAGTDVYVYLMEGQANEQIKNETREAINEAIQERKDNLYEEYKTQVRTITQTKKRADRRARWEDKVRRGLSDLGVSETEIGEYIQQVEMGWYKDYEHRSDDDDDDYDDYYDDY